MGKENFLVFKHKLFEVFSIIPGILTSFLQTQALPK